MILGLHHAQITIPKGAEKEGKQFYCNVLGLREVDKPKQLKGQGKIMDRIKVGRYVLEIDKSQTRKFYDKYHVITEDCDCVYCTNYILACDTFSPEVKHLFNLLGIDPRKEGEISEYMANDNGTHLYGAFYHIVGKIIDGPQLQIPTTSESGVSTPNSEEVEISFREEDLDLVPVDFPKPTVQFEIQLNIPWLLK